MLILTGGSREGQNGSTFCGGKTRDRCSETSPLHDNEKAAWRVNSRQDTDPHRGVRFVFPKQSGHICAGQLC